VALPLKPPLWPQLARSAKELPRGEQWCYEPKYDGFRAIAFVDGDELLLQSRGGKPLGRYFPELAFPSARYVLDGEIVIDAADGGQDFGALQQRIHPAASRIAMLAEQTPARYAAFDLLARDYDALLAEPFTARLAALEALLGDGRLAILEPLVGGISAHAFESPVAQLAVGAACAEAVPWNQITLLSATSATPIVSSRYCIAAISALLRSEPRPLRTSPPRNCTRFQAAPVAASCCPGCR